MLLVPNVESRGLRLFALLGSQQPQGWKGGGLEAGIRVGGRGPFASHGGKREVGGRGAGGGGVNRKPDGHQA